MSFFKKYPEISYLEENLDLLNSKELYIFEKIDGANVQLRKVEGRLRCGSRADWLDKKRQKPVWADAFEKWVYKNSKHANIPENLIVYGEWYGLNNIFYDIKLDSFFLIDVYDLKENRFLEYEKASEILSFLEIKDLIILPILKKGETNMQELEKMILRKSNFYNGPMEGIVIKDYKQQKFAKLLHPLFLDFRKDPNMPLVERYVTESRIKKSLMKVVDEEKPITIETITEELGRDIEKNHGIKIKKEILNIKVRPYLCKYSYFLKDLTDKINTQSDSDLRFTFATPSRKRELLEKYFFGANKLKVKKDEEINRIFREILLLSSIVNEISS